VIDLLEIAGFLDAATLDWIRPEMRAAEGDPATTVLGSTHRLHRPRARKATDVTVSDAVRATVVRRLESLQPQIETEFGRPLQGVEAPQFLRYRAGDYFVAHQDGNTPLMHDDSRFRRVTAVIFLSAQSEHPMPKTFCGGSLVLHGRVGEQEPPRPLSPAPGTLVAFPAETTHEVLPVTHGERLSIVSWYRG
jgi:SM-20-related protein